MRNRERVALPGRFCGVDRMFLLICGLSENGEMMDKAGKNEERISK